MCTENEREGPGNVSRRDAKAHSSGLSGSGCMYAVYGGMQPPLSLLPESEPCPAGGGSGSAAGYGGGSFFFKEEKRHNRGHQMLIRMGLSEY